MRFDIWIGDISFHRADGTEVNLNTLTTEEREAILNADYSGALEEMIRYILEAKQ